MLVGRYKGYEQNNDILNSKKVCLNKLTSFINAYSKLFKHVVITCYPLIKIMCNIMRSQGQLTHKSFIVYAHKIYSSAQQHIRYICICTEYRFVQINSGFVTRILTWRSFWFLRSSNIGIRCRNSLSILQTDKNTQPQISQRLPQQSSIADNGYQPDTEVKQI